jgi:uncharacterized protein
MSVEVRPYGVKCNIACKYCYQNEIRDSGNALPRYDLAKMKEAIERREEAFTLFGGEPLLMPRGDLETLWKWGYERFGANSVQTNGTLISEAHIALFRAYGVKVGISVDGPGELNAARWAGSPEATARGTERTHAAIARLCAEGLAPSLIVTLHRLNAARDRLPMLMEWLSSVERLGVTRVRLHVLEVDAEQVRADYALDPRASADAMTALMRFESERLSTLRFDVFDEMRRLLAGRDKGTSCVWNGCDPYDTSAVYGIDGNGQLTNCGRTNKDGVDFVKSGAPGYARYLALYATPQEDGGCADCRFFLMCKGQCPGTAIGGDWRNRTEHCGLWTELFTIMEAQALDRGEIPLSLHARRADVEAALLDAWADDRHLFVEDALAALAPA